MLTAIHGADDGAIDDAHDATAFVGTMAVSLVDVPQAAEHPPVPQMGGQAVLPRRFRSSALTRLRYVSAYHRDTRTARTARGPQHRHGGGADQEIDAGSYPQFVAMVSDATSGGLKW